MKPASFTSRRRHSHRGITLAETLVVIAVIAVIGGIIFGIAGAILNVIKSWQ